MQRHARGAPSAGRRQEFALAQQLITDDRWNSAGMLIDGVPEEPARESLPLSAFGPESAWRLVTGAPGSLVSVYRVEASYDPVIGPFYRDESPSREIPCDGDAGFLGAAGMVLESTVPNVDVGAADFLRAGSPSNTGNPVSHPSSLKSLRATCIGRATWS